MYFVFGKFWIILFLVVILLSSGLVLNSLVMILVLCLVFGFDFYWLNVVGIFGFLIIIIDDVFKLVFFVVRVLMLLVSDCSEGIIISLNFWKRYFLERFFFKMGNGIRYRFFWRINVSLELLLLKDEEVGKVFFMGVINSLYKVCSGGLLD